jgi:hypothetical protein
MREPSGRSPASSEFHRAVGHVHRCASHHCSPKVIGMLAATVFLISTSVVFLSGPAQATTYLGSSLSEGSTMPSDSFLLDPTGVYYLYMQPDGNLVQYVGSTALWASGTSGDSGAYAVFQADGNFVIYTTGGSPIWASHTYTFSGLTLQEQTDGNAVIYNGATALWNTATPANTRNCWPADTCNDSEFSWLFLGVIPQSPYPGGVNTWPLTIPNNDAVNVWTAAERIPLSVANPLATSLPEPGSYVYCYCSGANVQGYTDNSGQTKWYWGVRAIHDTITSGLGPPNNYQYIVNAVSAPNNDPYQQCVALATAVGNTRWGTGNFSPDCAGLP